MLISPTMRKPMVTAGLMWQPLMWPRPCKEQEREVSYAIEICIKLMGMVDNIYSYIVAEFEHPNLFS